MSGDTVRPLGESCPPDVPGDSIPSPSRAPSPAPRRKPLPVQLLFPMPQDPGLRTPTRRVTRSASLIAAFALCAAGSLLVPTTGTASAADSSSGTGPEQSRSAADFLNSMGVNVHMAYGGTRYANGQGTLDALRQLGITHVRDNISVGNKSEADRLSLLRDSGIRFDFVVPKPADQNYDPSK